MARSRLEAVGATGWTPLVGREQEIGLLLERWAQVVYPLAADNYLIPPNPLEYPYYTTA